VDKTVVGATRSPLKLAAPLAARLSNRGSDDSSCATARTLTAAITVTAVNTTPAAINASDRLLAVASSSIPDAMCGKTLGGSPSRRGSQVLIGESGRLVPAPH
jgi:hypothetical protein